MRYFRDEYEAHLEGRCPAGKCTNLIAYRINDQCIGCTLCAQNCPVDAIPEMIRLFCEGAEVVQCRRKAQTGRAWYRDASSAAFGLVVRGSPRTFTELAAAAQDRALESWGRVPVLLLATAFESVRRLCVAAQRTEQVAAVEVDLGQARG